MKEEMSAIGGSAYGGKIAIISDVHNNTVNLKKVLNYCKRENIETIVCCGDLASAETLDFLNDNYSGTIHYTFGNMDRDHLGIYENIKTLKHINIYNDFGELEIDGVKTAFTHYPDTAEELCNTGKYRFVFYGHTHKPFEKIINNCRMLNPGNVAGEIYLPTFAVWETGSDRFSLIRIHEL